MSHGRTSCCPQCSLLVTKFTSLRLHLLKPIIQNDLFFNYVFTQTYQVRRGGAHLSHVLTPDLTETWTTSTAFLIFNLSLCCSQASWLPWNKAGEDLMWLMLFPSTVLCAPRARGWGLSAPNFVSADWLNYCVGICWHTHAQTHKRAPAEETSIVGLSWNVEKYHGNDLKQTSVWYCVDLSLTIHSI